MVCHGWLDYEWTKTIACARPNIDGRRLVSTFFGSGRNVGSHDWYCGHYLLCLCISLCHDCGTCSFPNIGCCAVAYFHQAVRWRPWTKRGKSINTSDAFSHDVATYMNEKVIMWRLMFINCINEWTWSERRDAWSALETSAVAWKETHAFSLTLVETCAFFLRT